MESQVSAPEEVTSSWVQAVREFAVRGLLLCLTLFLLEVGIFFFVSSSPYFPGEHAFYTSQANQLSSQVTNSTSNQLLFQIFTNNFRIALIEMIPGFGAILFAISIYATARVTQAIAGIDNVPAVLLVLLLLLIFPHSFLELPAYAVATAEGLYLFYAGLYLAHALLTGAGGKLRRLSMEAWQFGINLLIVTVMLGVAALFETVEIVLGVYFWIMWVPFIGIIIAVIRFNRRLTRIRREATAKLMTPHSTPMADGQAGQALELAKKGE
jgi:uncharacterized membrane protein SpoIIM required for sporulation